MTLAVFHAPPFTAALPWQQETQNSNSAQHLESCVRGRRHARRVSAPAQASKPRACAQRA
jgi:hypothetical protein